MKFLFDFLPILLFFAVFKVAESNKEASLALVTTYLGGLMATGNLPADQAPMMLATAVAVVATIIQVLYLKARGRKVDGMLLVSCGVMVVFGGLTIYYHNADFIKWKPTIVYWIFAVAMAIAQFGLKRNLIRQAMQEQIALPEPIWHRMGLSYIALFAGLGVLNLLMAFVVWKDNMSAWVSFKSFGMPAILVVFMVAQFMLISKHVQEVPKQEEKA